MRFIDPRKRKFIIFEYGKPRQLGSFLNYSAGIWQFAVSPGTIIVNDDNGNTGYYSWDNDVVYNVQFVSVNKKLYTQVDSIADLYDQEESWFYDTVTTVLYLRFTNFEPPLDKQVAVGAIYGFSKNMPNKFLSGSFYDPRLESVSGVKKSKDPLFFGMLKFSEGNAVITNKDGKFDAWGDLNLYRQPTKILIGEEGDTYDELEQVFTGIIGNYSYSWSTLQIKNSDVRENLSTPIPYNQYTKSDYANLSDNNVGKFKPIAYGTIRGGQCICLNQEEAGPPATYTFQFMDVEFDAPTSITQVYVDGVAITHAGENLAAATFTLTAAEVGTNFDKVTVDFVGVNEDNGVEIIKDIMLNYADVAYLDDNYDTAEMAAAVTACDARNCCLYIKNQEDIKKAINRLCIDTDGLFFVKDNGLYTVRVYDANRTPAATIQKYDWIGEPSISNDTDEFLSSCIVKYSKNEMANTYRSYVNTDEEDDVFDLYGANQSKEFSTNLVNEASAILKAGVIMDSSKQVRDIVTRAVHFGFYDLEIMDFVICDPKCRLSGTEVPAVYEIIGVNKNFDSWVIDLTLKYINEYTP